MFFQHKVTNIDSAIRWQQSDMEYLPHKSDVTRLHFDILSSQRPHYRTKLLNRTYDFWMKSWQQTFTELKVSFAGFSDDFLNKEIGVLSDGEHPIGLLMYHFVDLSLPLFRESYYFKGYSDDLLESLASIDGKTMIITYMTVAPEWRQRQTNYSVPEMLISFSVLRFLESDAGHILGYFRNNKGTQNIFYRHGGQPILRNAHCYNVDVDYATVSRQDAKLSTKGQVDQVVQSLWNKYTNRHKGDKYVIDRTTQDRNEPPTPDIGASSLGKLGIL